MCSGWALEFAVRIIKDDGAAMSNSNRSNATVSLLLFLVVPMGNTRAIKARLGAARLVLEEMEADSSTHRAMSRLQS